MEVVPVAFEVEVVVMPALEDAPCFVVRDQLHPLDDVVRDARPAIGEPLLLILRRQRGDALRTVEDHGMSSKATIDSSTIHRTTCSHYRVEPAQGSGESP